MGVLLYFNEAAILYRDFNSAPSQKQNIIVFAANVLRMLCSADYYLVTCSQRRLLCADVCSARTSRRYQNRKYTAPSQFGIVGAANWQRRLVRAEHTSAHTITTTKGYFRTFFYGSELQKICRLADYSTPNNSRRYRTFAAPTIICCKYYYILLYQRNNK